jgi:hypothetical protein
MADDNGWDFSDVLGEVDATSNDMPDLDATRGTFAVRGEPLFDVSLEDAIDDPIQADGSCIKCGAPTFRPPGLTPGGNRKRVPKFCEDHDPKRQARSEKILKERGLDPATTRIAEELADDIRLFGTMVGVVYPVTGYYLLENADPFTTALVKLAAKNPKVLRVLHRAASVAPVYTVLQNLVGTAVAVQVDMNKMEPHSFAAERTGVDKAYDAVYPQGKDQFFENNGNGFNAPAPPTFHTVS